MTTGLKIGINIGLIIITIIVGFFLHKTGKPYSTAMLAVHKLLTVGFTIFITLMVLQVLKLQSPDALFTWVLVLSAVSLAGLLASGGMLSTDKFFDAALWIHRICTGVFVVSIAIMLWQLVMTKNVQ